MNDSSALIERVTQILSSVEISALGENLIQSDTARIVSADAQNIHIKLSFAYPANRLVDEIKSTITERFKQAQLPSPLIEHVIAIEPRIVQGGVSRLSGVKNTIVVSSAKGGVGKSATAVNVALALADEGARVGILDADIYGPSLHVMLGINKRPQGGANGGIHPIIAHGVQTMSIGFLIDKDQPAIWRGPIATRALLQLLQDTLWDNVDYLIVDMPPGTGDIQLTVAQKMPITGALIVTTPQELAVADAQKGLVMFNKVSVSILGVIENMSFYQCPKCGDCAYLFSQGGAQKLCDTYHVPLLGKMPLHPTIREDADSGTPTMIKSPDSDIAANYRQIAYRVAAQICRKPKDRSSAFPKVVVEN